MHRVKGAIRKVAKSFLGNGNAIGIQGNFAAKTTDVFQGFAVEHLEGIVDLTLVNHNVITGTAGFTFP